MEKPLKKPIIIQHFSHEHLLEHRLLPPEETCICFGCKLEVLPGKFCYKCKICPFYLHQVCYNMPQKVQHPVDPNHHLTLLALPFSNEESIDCKACQQSISGFYYNCATCGSFYHMLCLGTPLSIKLPVHPHKLDLEFSPPYKFQCDLCHRPSHRGWLYRCGLCEVDVHTSCAIMDSQTVENKVMSGNVKRGGGDRKHHELLELLLEGIMDSAHDHHKQAFQCQTPLSDNAAMPSLQFSDGCFSIDIERSFASDGTENKEAEFLQKVEVYEETKKFSYVVVSKGTFQDPKNANNHLKKPPSAIGSEVWVELGQKNEPSGAKKASSAGLQHQGRWCSCW